MNLRKSIKLVLLAMFGFFTLFISGCGGGNAHDNNPPVLTKLEINPQNVILNVGQSVEFEVVGVYSDDSRKDLTNEVIFTSSNSDIVTIESNVAEAISAGDAAITAATQDGTYTVTTDIKVLAIGVSLDHIELTFENGKTELSIPKGTADHLKAVAVYSDGTIIDITSKANYSYDSSVVDINNIDGRVIAVDTGESSIQAQFKDINSNIVTIKVTDATITDVTLSPSEYTLAVGEQVQFRAQGTFSDGTTKDITESANWNSSDVNVASIDSDGLATADNEGSATITASFNDMNGSADVIVKEANLSKLIIEPQGSITTPVGTTEKFTAAAIYSDGTEVDVTDKIEWISSDKSIAVFGSKNAGEAITLKVGTTYITAKYENIDSSNVTDLIVSGAEIVSVTIEPSGPVKVFTGEQIKFKAIGKYDDGTVKDITNVSTWISDDTSLITISQDGVATANNQNKESQTTVGVIKGVITEKVNVIVKNADEDK